ncbi:unnamed protein product [Linum tenue]|uniref:Small auxin up regulated protein n=1 Tax=Linum tenue TaxID=586396 RepID=A0AAV0JJ62_9ROSI|nr:unnamed protein product [Linum tenue]
MPKSNKIRHIVRIQQMLKQWRRKARANASSESRRGDVPAGHLAVCVGASCRRFAVRATHINHPIFKRVLAHAEEEFGFANAGPLRIPCEEMEFEEILKLVSRSDSIRRFLHLEEIQWCAHSCVVRRNSNSVEFVGDSRPLLRG